MQSANMYMKDIFTDYTIIVVSVAAVLILVLLIMNIVSLVNLKNIKKKYNAFMEGKDAKTLEDSIITRFQEIDDLKLSSELQQKDIQVLKETILKTYQKFGLVKYDAFKEMGGQLSFSLAMLDKKNNGFLLNTVHNREGSYTYVKEILDGKSKIDLSEEEREALEKAVSIK